MKPSIPKGTRDFGPAQMARRTFLFDTLRTAFQRYGFAPLETPTMENLSVLMGKYGEEGDQLLFKVLDSGNFLEKITAADLAAGYRKFTPKVAEKGLRYDLTVPFARYVVMHQHEIKFPFKRYQMQPVWRGDRPQKGRYREFYQCDADVVGTDALLCEAEIVLLIHDVFASLGLPDFTLKINNRKVLTGIADVVGASGREADLCVAIDKLDKIGRANVEAELRQRGFAEESVVQLAPVFEMTGDTDAVLAQLRTLLASSETGLRGVDELAAVWQLVRDFGLPTDRLQLDITLARGLSYYTGAIFEVQAHGVAIGSVCGGGRYDNLTGAFGLPNVSGVGISFGVERIYDVLDEMGLFPDLRQHGTRVLLTNFDATAQAYALPLLRQLRQAGIAAEIYTKAGKLTKQFEYATARAIPYLLLVGSEEMQSGMLTLKDLATGTQQRLDTAGVIAALTA